MEFQDTITGRFMFNFPNAETINFSDRWRTIDELSAQRAIHNSEERYDPPKCHPNTRVAIRNRLMSWIIGATDVDTPILWFYGAAGTGKSAIAQTIAETCTSEKLLLASFFFSKTDPTRNTISRLVATIAYQIGTAFPTIRRLIVMAIERNCRIFSEPFATQLMELIAKPLSEFAEHHGVHRVPQLVIIDGLDECLDPCKQSKVVAGFSEALTKHCGLRLLIVSRPEDHLKKTFCAKVPAALLSRLALDDSFTSDDDIRVFLQDQFAHIKENHPQRSRIPIKWPAPNALDYLVKRSLGQFVYASMVAKYVSANDGDPITRLISILKLCCRRKDKGLPYAEMDALYLHILSSSKDVQTTWLILGVILFVDPDYDFFAPLNSAQLSAAQTLSGVEALLALEPGTVKACLSELYPMFLYSASGTIYVPHATVAEYLNDSARSNSFHLGKDFVLTTLIGHCFENVEFHSGRDNASILFAYGRIPQLCTKVPHAFGLQTHLMEFSLIRCYQWCQNNTSQIGVGLQRTSVFHWWYVTKYLVILRQLEATTAYIHHLAAFDKMVQSSLSKYTSIKDVYLLTALASIPARHLNLSQKRVINFLSRLHVTSTSSTLEFTLDLDKSKDGLGLFESIYFNGELFDNGCFRLGLHWDKDIVLDTYYQFLFDFFKDPTRSGQYFLSPEAYASAAFQCSQFISRTPSDTEGHEWDEVDPNRVALFFIPRLLAKASKSEDLLLLIRSNEFKSNFPLNTMALDDAEDVRKAIAEYEERWRWRWFPF